MTEFEKVGFEIVKFMRGNYRLDEVAGMFYDVPCVKFRLEHALHGMCYIGLSLQR